MIGLLLDGRYQVTRVLGAGGFSQTYLASDTRIPGHPTCVVKHLKTASTDPKHLQTARRLFASEAEILAKLGKHEQIPRLLAYFDENQEFYLVQEFIEGHTLGTELPPGRRWSESEVIQMLQDVLGILVFVHSNGVIHRDIKPDNIIRRSQDNKLVLIDFGAIKQVGTQAIAENGLGSHTVAIGTPGYMPTEQAQGRPRPNSDIYALGKIGIQALTALYPHQIQQDVNTAELIWQSQAQVSPRLAALLTKMTRYHFKDRYQTATETLQALQQVTKPYTPPSPTLIPPIGRLTPPPPRVPTRAQSPTSEPINAKALLKAVGGGVLLGLVGIVVVVGVVGGRLPYGKVIHSTQVSSTRLTEQQAVALINQFLSAKGQILGPPFDLELLAQFTTGKDYENRLGSIEWLQNNNAYYVYGPSEARATGKFKVKGDRATVEVKVKETPTFYVNGRVDRATSVPYEGIYLFTLQKKAGSWKISKSKKID